MRPLGVAAAAVAVLAVAACGGEPDPAPRTPTGDAGAAWSDRVCGSVLSFTGPATAAPDFDAAGDLAAVQRTYSGYLGEVVAGVRAGRSALDAAGPAPVPAGDAAAGRIRDGMTRLEQDFTGAKATVDAADPTSPRGFVASVTQVESTLTSIAVPDVLGELDAVPEIAAAARQAPLCQKIRTLAAAAPR